MFALSTVATLLLPLVAAHPSWYQPIDSPHAALFKRDGPAPDPNSPDFSSHYPPAFKTPNDTTLPQAWTDKLKTITLPPNNPVSTLKGCCSINYGDKGDGMQPDICSFTAGCHTDSDLFAGPDGVFVLTFDDGPSDASPELYDFLQNNNISSHATHFMIGGNIMGDPLHMQDAFKRGGHIAVHTWSHHYTTALSNEGVLAELGWTMQIIADLTGGRIPAFWRPPYGDVDNRVRAIAEQVFGLKTVVWNRDTNDWAIGSKPEITVDSVKGTMSGWFTGPKSPGILALEHELNKNCVDVFMSQFSGIAQNGWSLQSVADAFGMKWYQNSANNTAPVTQAKVAVDPVSNIFTNATAPTSSGSMSALGSATATGTGSHSGSASATASKSSEAGKTQNNKNNSGVSAVVVPGVSVFVAALAALAL